MSKTFEILAQEYYLQKLSHDTLSSQQGYTEQYPDSYAEWASGYSESLTIYNEASPDTRYIEAYGYSDS